MQHKAFITEVIYPDPDATEDHGARLMSGPVCLKIRKGANVSHLLKNGGKIPRTKDFPAVGPDGALTSSATIDNLQL